MKLKDIHSNSRGNKQLKGGGADVKPILRLLRSKEGSRTEIKSMVWIRITVTRRRERSWKHHSVLDISTACDAQTQFPSASRIIQSLEPNTHIYLPRKERKQSTLQTWLSEIKSQCGLKNVKTIWKLWEETEEICYIVCIASPGIGFFCFWPQ